MHTTTQDRAAESGRVASHDYPSWGDSELLSQFLAGRDEAAFATLVLRYRQTVLGACLRVLRNAQDAEDASQAAFLVLARKARSLLGQATLGGWLHEVARRTALKLRGQRRATKALEADPPAAGATLSDLSETLDEELQKLPQPLRETLIACCLEGLSRTEAAARLGVSEGAVKDRLERGRELLRSRLVRRGLTLSAGFTALFLGGASAALAAPPAATSVAATAQAACLLVGGSSLAGIVPAAVVTLAEGVLKAMLFQKLKFVLYACVSVLVAGLAAQAMLIDNPDRFENALCGHVVEVLAGNPRTITFTVEEHGVQLNLDVAPDAKVHLAYEQAEFADLRPGMFLAVKLGTDHRTISEIQVLGQTRDGRVVSYDPASRLVTVELQADDDDEESQPPRNESYSVAAGAITRFDDAPGRTEDLEPGLPVKLELAKDLRSVNAVSVEWRQETDIVGEITSRDPATGKLTILADETEIQQELTFAGNAKVFLDGKPARSEDLRPNDEVVLRYTDDGAQVAVCRAVRPAPEPEDEDQDRDE